MDFGTDAGNSVVVEVRQCVLANVWNVAGHDFWPKLGFTDFDHKVNDVYRGKSVILNQLAADDDGVLEVVTAPWHKGGNQVFSKSQFAVLDRHTFNQYIALLY